MSGGNSDEGVGNAGLGRSAFIVGAERCRFEGLVAVGDGGEEISSFAHEVFSVACSGYDMRQTKWRWRRLV